MEFNWPLMRDNISAADIQAVIDFLQTHPRLTQSERVRAFEQAWSRWLGVEYSVFVNSGSSANLITLCGLRHLLDTGRLGEGAKGRNEVIVSPLGWVSDVVAVIRAGFKPVFADIDLATLSMNSEAVLEKVGEKTLAVLLVHAQGFCGLDSKLLSGLEEHGVLLIEDVCESHGAEFEGRRLGGYGFASNFSFYFAHHMSTIEGGMVCSNDADFYQLMRMMRSHGMVREVDSDTMRLAYEKDYPDLNPKFIFSCMGFNVRNTEIGGVLGLAQLDRLENECRRRAHNLEIFLEHLDAAGFFAEFDLRGCSNYAFPVILRDPDLSLRSRLEATMDEQGIEYRRGNAGGGNQLRQPYLKAAGVTQRPEDLPVTDHVHFFGYYIGNYPDLSDSRIVDLADTLNRSL